MNLDKQRKFNEKMGRTKLAHGGYIKRQKLASGGTLSQDVSSAASGAALGTAILPGIGTAIGAVGGFLSGLFGGSSAPQPPNITDPVTGQQITDANGNVVATQQQLQTFATNLQGVNGVQNQQAVLGQLQNVANGTGPNPAMAQLAQTTGTNVANTAALMAGQRGAAANVGLEGRQIGQQGAATQQQAVGQGATLAANQELNALNSEGAIAGQQVGETQAALTGANAAATNNQGQLLNAQGQYNTNITGGQANVNTTNQSQQVQNATAAGNLTNAVGTALAGSNNSNPPVTTIQGGSDAGQSLSHGSTATGEYKGGAIHKKIPGPHKSHVANFLMSKGGEVPAMVSPGEVYLSPEKVGRVLNGENPLKIGERFQGKAKVKGNSKKNDTIPKTLEEGGVVIPRTHVGDPERAELFTRRAVHMKKAGK